MCVSVFSCAAYLPHGWMSCPVLRCHLSAEVQRSMGLFVCLMLLWLSLPYAFYPPSVMREIHSIGSPFVPCYTCLAFAVLGAIRSMSVDPLSRVTVVLFRAFDSLCPVSYTASAVQVDVLPQRVSPVLWVTYSSWRVGCVGYVGCSLAFLG